MMLKKRARFWLAMTLTVSLLSLSFACGGKKETADEGGGGDTTAKTFAPKGDEGTITGKVNLTGTPPAPQPIDMSQDANCKANNTNPITETVVAKDGKLQNAFVYIKDGTLADGSKIGDYSFEILIPVKCNQHPWMKAYIGVIKHPFFAVSKDDGTFELKGVPPGTYTVAAWHEKYGEKTAQVKVDAKGTATTDFSFDAGAASASLESGSLEVMPAMDLPMLMKH